MSDAFQGINSGQGELKNFYEKESQYEAIKRRRKKAAEKNGIIEEEKYDWDEVTNPAPNY